MNVCDCNGGNPGDEKKGDVEAYAGQPVTQARPGMLCTSFRASSETLVWLRGKSTRLERSSLSCGGDICMGFPSWCCKLSTAGSYG